MKNFGFKKYDKYIFYAVWALYVILLCFVSFYHEPWHDEGQAWLIARDDSIWQMITVTLHWEGHPPLWHLFLMPFAKMGVPFELGLKSVNIACCSFAMWLLVIKSPLPWYFRYFLPFNYYFFYQYGVISRCYSLLMAGMMLCAYYYPSRKEKPFHLALSMALLAGSQAYGMMLACGIALAWLIEILQRDYKQTGGIVELYKKSTESKGLLLLFVIALFFVYCMSPRQETLFTAGGAKTGFWQNIFYLFAISPGILFFSNDIKDSYSLEAVNFFYVHLKNAYMIFKAMGWSGILVFLSTLISYSYGVIIHGAFIYCAFVTRKLLLYILPLICYSILAGLVHWNVYHGGTLLCFFVFALWQVFSERESLVRFKEHFCRQFPRDWEYKGVQVGLALCLLLAWCKNLYWSGSASIHDYSGIYDCSSTVAAFIKENQLDKSGKIWTVWEYQNSKDGLRPSLGPFNINSYFSSNVLQNVNEGKPRPAYHKYVVNDLKKFQVTLYRMGQPDFIMGDAPLFAVFEKPEEYIPIKEFSGGEIWKDEVKPWRNYMFMKKELMSKYPQFHELPMTEEDVASSFLLTFQKYGLKGIEEYDKKMKKWHQERLKAKKKLLE